MRSVARNTRSMVTADAGGSDAGLDSNVISPPRKRGKDDHMSPSSPEEWRSCSPGDVVQVKLLRADEWLVFSKKSKLKQWTGDDLVRVVSIADDMVSVRPCTAHARAAPIGIRFSPRSAQSPAASEAAAPPAPANVGNKDDSEIEMEPKVYNFAINHRCNLDVIIYPLRDNAGLIDGRQPSGNHLNLSLAALQPVVNQILWSDIERQHAELLSFAKREFTYAVENIARENDVNFTRVAGVQKKARVTVDSFNPKAMEVWKTHVEKQVQQYNHKKECWREPTEVLVPELFGSQIVYVVDLTESRGSQVKAKYFNQARVLRREGAKQAIAAMQDQVDANTEYLLWCVFTTKAAYDKYYRTHMQKRHDDTAAMPAQK
jgi:hypothetical protein